jgi:hypothetical protein
MEESSPLQSNSKILSQTFIYPTSVPMLIKNFSKPEGAAPNKKLGRMNSVL